MCTAALRDMRGGRPEVFAGLTIDSLPFVAPMIDAFGAPELFELPVRQVGDFLAGARDPLPSVELAALHRATTFRVLAIRATEPVARRSLDAVISPFGNHHVHMRVVLNSGSVVAGMNGERVRQVLFSRQGVDDIARELDLIFSAELARKCEVTADK